MDESAGQRSGAASYYHERRTHNHQVAGNVSYYRDDWHGTHNFKFGAELFLDRLSMARFQPGDAYYFDTSQGVPGRGLDLQHPEYGNEPYYPAGTTFRRFFAGTHVTSGDDMGTTY